MDPSLSRVTSLAAELTGFEPADLDPAVPLVELGFDSLVLTQLAQRIRKETGVDFSFRDFFEGYRTLDAVAGRIREAGASRPGPPPSDGPVVPLALLVKDPDAPAPGDDLLKLLQGQLQVIRTQLSMLAEGTGDALPPPSREAAEDPTVGAAGSPTAAASTASSGPRVHRPRRELTPHQEAEVVRFIDEWTKRTEGSRVRAERDRPHHADPRTAAGFHPRWKEIVYPLVVERSRGPFLWDVDGNRYIDLLNGFGPGFFGHSPGWLVEAVRTRLKEGFELGPQTPLAGEAAALLCKLTGMDRASFVCTGSEAVQAAIRVARTCTGRDKIAVFAGAYHGNFDQVLVRGVGDPARMRTVPSAPGIPPGTVEDMVVLEYGTDQALQRIREMGPDLAGVLVEPVQSRRPELQPREFLHELRTITRESGTLLIFDEIVTGFRCHPGGAQAVFQVEADLATYGKVLGGGMPVGAIAGRRPFIDALDGGPWRFGDDSGPTQGVTFLAGTFFRHPLVMAATLATLQRLDDGGGDLQDGLSAKASGLVTRLRKIAGELGAPLEIPHFSSVLLFRPTEPGNDLNTFFFHLMRSHGVFLLEGFPCFLTLAHEEAHIDQIVEAFGASVERMGAMGAWDLRGASPRDPVPVDPGGGKRPSEPPVPGARLGRDRDGSAAWFVEDPDRPGAFIRVG